MSHQGKNDRCTPAAELDVVSAPLQILLLAHKRQEQSARASQEAEDGMLDTSENR
jgi:hypothetical protein